MSHTLFIADLHLSADRPDITRCLKTFLTEQAPQADALYVLGDLFEYWIGDDDVNEFNSEIAQAFRSLSKQGVPIFFIHGNRDFLIGKKFARRAGMTILPEQKVVNIYGTNTLLMHGDELCTRDVAYQKFRKKARGWWWPRLMLSLPLSARRRIAENGRKESKKNQQKLNAEIMDVTELEVQKSMQAHGVRRMIHGHTHRPNVHRVDLGQTDAQRIVLGDWYEQGSVLKVEKSGFELSNLVFKDED